MLFQSVISPIVVNLRLLSILGFIPFWYDANRGEFVVRYPDSKRADPKAILILVAVSILLLDGVHTMIFAHKGITSTRMALIIAFVLGFSTGICIAQPLLGAPMKYVDLMNMTGNFEKSYFHVLGKLDSVMFVLSPRFVIIHE